MASLWYFWMSFAQIPCLIYHVPYIGYCYNIRIDFYSSTLTINWDVSWLPYKLMGNEYLLHNKKNLCINFYIYHERIYNCNGIGYWDHFIIVSRIWIILEVRESIIVIVFLSTFILWPKDLNLSVWFIFSTFNMCLVNLHE